MKLSVSHIKPNYNFIFHRKTFIPALLAFDSNFSPLREKTLSIGRLFSRSDHRHSVGSLAFHFSVQHHYFFVLLHQSVLRQARFTVFFLLRTDTK